jgi:hypothetical protein
MNFMQKISNAMWLTANNGQGSFVPEFNSAKTRFN